MVKSYRALQTIFFVLAVCSLALVGAYPKICAVCVLTSAIICVLFDRAVVRANIEVEARIELEKAFRKRFLCPIPRRNSRAWTETQNRVDAALGLILGNDEFEEAKKLVAKAGFIVYPNRVKDYMCYVLPGSKAP